jgi:multisubunit Na+/H+ antiporter MnhG subunit
MEIVIFLIEILGALLLLLSGVAIFRTKDVFTMTHVTMIFGIYVLPMVLLTIAIEKFSLVVLLKILLLIFFNWLATHLICYLATKEALKNNILPDVVAEIRR